MYNLNIDCITSSVSCLGKLVTDNKSVSTIKHFSLRFCKCIAEIISEFKSRDLGGTGDDFNKFSNCEIKLFVNSFDSNLDLSLLMRPLTDLIM